MNNGPVVRLPSSQNGVKVWRAGEAYVETTTCKVLVSEMSGLQSTSFCKSHVSIICTACDCTRIFQIWFEDLT